MLLRLLLWHGGGTELASNLHPLPARSCCRIGWRKRMNRQLAKPCLTGKWSLKLCVPVCCYRWNRHAFDAVMHNIPNTHTALICQTPTKWMINVPICQTVESPNWMMPSWTELQMTSGVLPIRKTAEFSHSITQQVLSPWSEYLPNSDCRLLFVQRATSRRFAAHHCSNGVCSWHRKTTWHSLMLHWTCATVILNISACYRWSFDFVFNCGQQIWIVAVCSVQYYTDSFISFVNIAF